MRSATVASYTQWAAALEQQFCCSRIHAAAREDTVAERISGPSYSETLEYRPTGREIGLQDTAAATRVAVEPVLRGLLLPRPNGLVG